MMKNGHTDILQTGLFFSESEIYGVLMTLKLDYNWLMC